MNQPSSETMKLLLQLIKPIAKKRMLEEQKTGGEMKIK
jgi:hypothetical protein